MGMFTALLPRYSLYVHLLPFKTTTKFESDKPCVTDDFKVLIKIIQELSPSCQLTMQSSLTITI